MINRNQSPQVQSFTILLQFAKYGQNEGLGPSDFNKNLDSVQLQRQCEYM